MYFYLIYEISLDNSTVIRLDIEIDIDISKYLLLLAYSIHFSENKVEERIRWYAQ